MGLAQFVKFVGIGGATVMALLVFQVLLIPFSFGWGFSECECDSCQCSTKQPLGECPCGYNCKCRYGSPSSS